MSRTMSFLQDRLLDVSLALPSPMNLRLYLPSGRLLCLVHSRCFIVWPSGHCTTRTLECCLDMQSSSTLTQFMFEAIGPKICIGLLLRVH